MKVLVALSTLLAVAVSAPFTPLTYSAGVPVTYSAGTPLMYEYSSGIPVTYSAGTPVTYPAGIPLTYSAGFPLQPEIATYSAEPIEQEVDVLHPGYVAITPGAKHVASLPYGGISHHVNLKKAEGTR